jgi:hypothetical protein
LVRRTAYPLSDRSRREALPQEQGGVMVLGLQLTAIGVPRRRHEVVAPGQQAQIGDARRAMAAAKGQERRRPHYGIGKGAESHATGRDEQGQAKPGSRKGTVAPAQCADGDRHRSGDRGPRQQSAPARPAQAPRRWQGPPGRAARRGGRRRRNSRERAGRGRNATTGRGRKTTAVNVPGLANSARSRPDGKRSPARRARREGRAPPLPGPRKPARNRARPRCRRTYGHEPRPSGAPPSGGNVSRSGRDEIVLGDPGEQSFP